MGIGEYQARKLDAVVIHLHLVFLVYTFIKNAWRNPHLQKVLNKINVIGSACEKLKRWVFDQMSNQLKTPLIVEIG